MDVTPVTVSLFQPPPRALAPAGADVPAHEPEDRLSVGRVPAAPVAAPAADPQAELKAVAEQAAVAVAGSLAGGLPATIALASLPQAAIREAMAHMKELGLKPDQSPISDLAQAELARAVKIDGRVTAAHMASAMQRAMEAMELTPHPQADLFGFTRLMDSKFWLTQPIASADNKTPVELLADLATKPLTHPDGQPLPAPETAEQILEYIKNGPPDRDFAWSKPETPGQLIASWVRQMLLGDGGSRQIGVTAGLARWMEAALASLPVEVRDAMGGAGAFCANLAGAQDNVVAHFLSPERIPAGIGELFGDTVGLAGADGQVRAPDEWTNDEKPRINYSAEYHKATPFKLFGREEVTIGSKTLPLQAGGTSRVITGTPSSEKPDFGETPADVLQELAWGHNLFFFAGPHYYTKGTPDECRAQTQRFALGLAAMKAANHDLLIHFQYVVPKHPPNEAILMEGLRGRIDSISMNAVEVPPLLGRCRAAGLLEWFGNAQMTKDQAEMPVNLLNNALALKAGMSLSRVHLHGFAGDLLVMDTPPDKEPHTPSDGTPRQVLALLKARQMSSMKAANDSGAIVEKTDMWPLYPTVDGECLAAAQSFADAIAIRFHLDDEARNQVAENWYYEDKTSGQTIYFVPSRGVHDRTGGSVSLGDTIDSTALIYGFEPAEQVFH